MIKEKHIAYNLSTHEMIGTNNGNHLKRHLKWHRRYNGSGKWVFSHDGYNGITKKLIKHGLIKG